jgi:hypothetical protein
MKKYFVFFIISTLLFGLSATLCNAQNKRKTPKQRMEDLKKEKAAKDSSATVFYRQEVERLEKEKADLEKEKADLEKEKADLKESNSNLRTQADERAKIESKLQEKEKENLRLKSLAIANKAEADSMAKQLLATKMILAEKEKNKNINSDASVADLTQKNPVPADSAKKDSVKVIKKIVTHTRVLSTMVKGDTAFVPVKEQKLVPIQKKGTIILLEEKTKDENGNEVTNNIARIRKSDVGANEEKIKELIDLGYKLEEVNR